MWSRNNFSCKVADNSEKILQGFHALHRLTMRRSVPEERFNTLDWPGLPKQLVILDHLDRAVMITMSVVLMMQVPIDEVVHVVSMGNRRMTASWTVNMVFAMG